ncbi:MAG: von Willebrand factor type A domain-containing protein [Rikenellaceae bacterium]|nr:von Willebrand factor type A domain-containing protein [Rikenellaceae bacterium]
MNIKEYIKGKRTGSEARRIELESMRDGFLKEALDGLDACEGDHAGALDRLSSRLADRTRRAAKTPPVPLWRRTALIRSAAAVVVFLLVGGLVYRYSLFPELNPADYAAGGPAEADYMEEEITIIREVSPCEKEDPAVEFPQPPPVIITVPDVVSVVSDMIIFGGRDELLEYDLLFDDAQYDDSTVPRPEASSRERAEYSSRTEASSGEQIYGTVTDSEGQPLIGAAVVVQGTSTGALTDVYGMFLLRANVGDILEVKHLGYVTEAVAVTGPGMHITLAESASQIEEVVVTALGVRRKSQITGSVSTVEPESLSSRERGRSSKSSKSASIPETDKLSSRSLLAGGKFIDARNHPVSSFRLEVHGDSYDYIKSTLQEGNRPQSSRVKIEELLNSKGSINTPVPQVTVGVSYQVGECPWNPENRLVIITVAAAESVTGAKVEVRFDPKGETSYKLLGYEDGAMQPKLEPDAPGEEMAPGSRTVAMYEIVPAGSAAGESMRVVVTYRENNRKREKKTEISVKGGGSASLDNNLYAAVAWFGQLLRESAPGSRYRNLYDFAVENLPADGRSGELLELIGRAMELAE